MLKKLLVTTAAVVFAAGVSIASQIPIVSGPQDPSQLLSTINTLIQSINAGVNGRLTAQVTATGTTTTGGESTMATYTLPASTLANPGDAVRVLCWGGTASNGNAKTARLYFGTSSIIWSTSGTGYSSPNNKPWYLELIVMRNGAATQQVMGRGTVDASPMTLYAQAGSDTLTSAVTIKCTGLTPTAVQDMTAQGFLVEQIK